MDDEHAPNILSIFLLDFFQFSAVVRYCACDGICCFFSSSHSLFHRNCLFFESYHTNTVWLLSFNISTHVRYELKPLCILFTTVIGKFGICLCCIQLQMTNTSLSCHERIDNMFWTIQSEKRIDYFRKFHVVLYSFGSKLSKFVENFDSPVHLLYDKPPETYQNYWKQ